MFVPLLTALLKFDPGIVLIGGTIAGMVGIPLYVLTHVFELAEMKPGTKGWNPVGSRFEKRGF